MEVRQTTNTAGTSWSNWVRLSSAQSGTSYTDSAITASKKVDGYTPFVGVKYQYRVRSSDGSYATSSWISPSDLSVGFGSPTAPTSYSWSKTKVKLDEYFTLTWNSGSAGSGTLEGYEVTYRAYLTNTEGFTKNAWTSWTSNSIQSGRSEQFIFSSGIFHAGDLMQARIRTKNSYDQYSSYLYTSYVTVADDGVIYIKVNDTWREGTPYIKVNDTWREGTPYIKVNDTWREGIQ